MVAIIVLGDIMLDLLDELRWQIKMLPSRFWKQKYPNHRRFY